MGDETRPEKLAAELEREATELQRREEWLGEQIDAARKTWRSHRETAAPPAPDAPTEHTPEQTASVTPPEDEAESRQED
jgi:hypothetical protein